MKSLTKASNYLFILVTFLFIVCDCKDSWARISIPSDQADSVAIGERPNGIIEKLRRHLDRIPALLDGIDERLLKAQKVRDEFHAEVTELRATLKRSKPDRGRRDIQTAIDIKDEYIKLIDDYTNKLSNARDYLVNVQLQFSEFRRAQLVIDQSFVLELTRFIQDTSDLLQDPTIRSVMARYKDSGKNYKM
jgi:hypothetical protein